MSEFEGVLPDLEGIEDKDLRELIERSAQIEALTSHPGWAYFKDYMIALTGSRQKRILGGYCQTMEEYRYESGYISGIQEALNAPNRLFEQIQNAHTQASLARGDEEEI